VVRALLLAFAAVVLLPARSSARLPSWNLGHGYSAAVSVRGAEDAGMRRVLAVSHGGAVVRRFSRADEGLGVQVADVSGDGVKDVLVLDYWDGSGACGEYSFFASPSFARVWHMQQCADIAITRLVGSALVTWTVVGSSKTKASGTYIHCCWTKWRRTEWRVRHGRLVRARFVVGPPPPERWRVHLLPGANA
jgi:hypothetical protein